MNHKDKMRQRLQALSQLKVGWLDETYGVEMTPKAIQIISELIDILPENIKFYLYPTAEGEIKIEFENSKYCFDFETESNEGLLVGMVIDQTTLKIVVDVTFIKPNSFLQLIGDYYG